MRPAIDYTSMYRQINVSASNNNVTSNAIRLNFINQINYTHNDLKEDLNVKF